MRVERDEHTNPDSCFHGISRRPDEATKIGQKGRLLTKGSHWAIWQIGTGEVEGVYYYIVVGAQSKSLSQLCSVSASSPDCLFTSGSSTPTLTIMDAKERVNVSLIGGNASIDLKRSFFDIFYEQLASPKGAKGFESEIASRIMWKEMSLLEVAEEPEKLEGRTVFEITVEDGVYGSCLSFACLSFGQAWSLTSPCLSYPTDMVNPAGALHGGCSALLINRHVLPSQPWSQLTGLPSCSTIPIALLSLATTGRAEFGASQSLSIVYHSPAMLYVRPHRLALIHHLISRFQR